MLTNFMRVFIQTLTVIVVICVGLGNTGPVTHDGRSSLSPNETLRRLTEEAERTGDPFEQAWIKSKTIYETKVKDTLKKYAEALNEGEMRIIIAYTLEKPPFYKDLNMDIRDHFSDLSNQRYPQATRILSMALKKLGEFQRKNGLPEVVYRKENKTAMLPIYKDLKKSGKSGVLKQFTSTSRSRNALELLNISPAIITTFKEPKVGADIDEFSNYEDEEEFLLPYNVNYRVKRIENDEVTLEGFDYINTGHHLEMSYSFSLFSFLLYILLN